MSRRVVVLSAILVLTGLSGVVGLAFNWLHHQNAQQATPHTINARDVDRGSAIAVPESEPFVSFLVVGDTGENTPQRAHVVAAMAEQLNRLQPQFVILAGDNFYDSGVTSVTDPRWLRDFENAFEPDQFPVHFYACLGNHDHLGSCEAQFQYSSQSDRWQLPNYHYRFDQNPDGPCSASFFVIDTTPIVTQMPNCEKQIDWLASELADCTADWKIVIGHHPTLSGGEHGADPNVAALVTPLLEEYQVDLYISGHDHDLQLHDSGSSWLQLISGAGSRLRSTCWVDSTLYAEAAAGFACIVLTTDSMDIELRTADSRRYTYRKSAARPE